jgi:hypothetical protein
MTEKTSNQASSQTLDKSQIDSLKIFTTILIPKKLNSQQKQFLRFYFARVVVKFAENKRLNDKGFLDFDDIELLGYELDYKGFELLQKTYKTNLFYELQQYIIFLSKQIINSNNNNHNNHNNQNNTTLIYSTSLSENLEKLAEYFNFSKTDTPMLQILQFLYIVKNGKNTIFTLNHLDLNTDEFMGILSFAINCNRDEVKKLLQNHSQLATSGMLKIKNNYGDCSFLERFNLPVGLSDKLFLQQENLLDVFVHSFKKASTLDECFKKEYDNNFHINIAIDKISKVIANAKRPLNILIYGKSKTKKTQLAKVIAGSFDCELYSITESENTSRQERLNAYQFANNILDKGKKHLILFDNANDIFAKSDISLFGAFYHSIFKKITKNRNKDFVNDNFALNEFLKHNKNTTFWIVNNTNYVSEKCLQKFDYIFSLNASA